MFSSLSVIIPTYNRKNTLSKVLQAYLAQSAPQFIRELIVVDDGSTDGTDSTVMEFSQRAPFPIHYLRQANKGAGAARNYGIREAISSIAVLTDDDIVPERDFVEQHLQWHNRNPQITVAVLGYITWAPEMKATPFMRWCAEDGAVTRYRSLQGLSEADHHFFYTGNVSLKTQFARSGGEFDEDFKTYGYEDLEFAHRLNKLGLRLLYNSAAIGYQYQRLSYREACNKARSKRDAARVFFWKGGWARAFATHSTEAFSYQTQNYERNCDDGGDGAFPRPVPVGFLRSSAENRLPFALLARCNSRIDGKRS